MEKMGQERIRPKIQYKVIIIIGTIVLSYVLGFFIFKSYEDKRFSIQHQEYLAKQRDVLDNLLNIKGYVFENVVNGIYSRWDNLVEFIREPNKDFAEKNLDILVFNYDFDIVWVYDQDFNLVYVQNITLDPNMDEVPIPVQERKNLFSVLYSVHFFYPSKFGLLEIRGATVNLPSDNIRAAQAKGYFFLGRLWNEEHIRELEDVTLGVIKLVYPEKKGFRDNSYGKGKYTINRSLQGYDGKDVASIIFTGQKPTDVRFDVFANNLFVLYLLLCLLIAILISLLLIRWIYNPIKIISKSLASNNPEHLNKIINKNDEFAQLSVLVEDSIRQKKDLVREIMRKEESEKILKIREGKFRTLIDQIPDYVVIHQEGKIIYLNDAVLTNLGYKKKEVLNSNILNFIAKEDHSKVVKAMRRRLEGEELEDYEISILDSAGNEHTVLSRSVLITYEEKPAVLAFLVDISDRKKYEDELLESRAWLKSLLDNLPYKAWIKDLRGRFVAVNAPFAEYYGMSPEDLKGRTDYDICPENIAREYEKEDQEVIAKKKRMYYELDRPDLTEKVWIETYKAPILDNDGEIIGITGIARDITELKMKQFELIEAKEEADAANQAKQQFLSTISHEMRNQLNAIMGLTSILLDESPKPEQIDNLRTVSFSAEQLLTLINDILDFSKIDAQKIDIEEREFPLRDLIASMKHSFSPKAEEKDIRFFTDVDENIPQIIIGDSYRINQILTNLIGNAFKFTNEGRIGLTVKLLKQTEEKVRLQFKVEDTGIGIPEDRIEGIFDPFVQANKNQLEKIPGSGLGLSITKKLIELQGGEINVASEVGRGSVFKFILELRYLKDKEQEIEKSEKQSSFSEIENVRILLVEDNHINRVIAKKYLTKWGAIVHEADNGIIALEKLRENQYDIILMDLQMPVMDGFETTQKIREGKNKRIKDIPIIALTASAMLEVREQVIDSGMNDFITKPFNPVELNNIIAKYI